MHLCANHNACIDTALNTADSICQEKGLRFTPLRRKVLAMVWESHTPAKAYDILDKLKQEDGSAKPPTVYRTLDFLLENGLVHKVNSLNAYVGCSHPLQHSTCYFLICTECHEITECCNEPLTHAVFSTAEENGFYPQHTTLEIQGQCENCQSKQ